YSAEGRGKLYVQGMNTPRFPVENMSWDQVQTFCRRLSEHPAEKEQGRVYRLPTEAEWEYACRAGTTTPYHTGLTLTPDDANVANRLGYPRPVGSYRPNAWGLYDMHGNAWELVADMYEPHTGKRQVNPTGPEKGRGNIARGGSVREGIPLARSACRVLPF